MSLDSLLLFTDNRVVKCVLVLYKSGKVESKNNADKLDEHRWAMYKDLRSLVYRPVLKLCFKGCYEFFKTTQGER